jgi:hypothetical protein
MFTAAAAAFFTFRELHEAHNRLWLQLMIAFRYDLVLLLGSSNHYYFYCFTLRMIIMIHVHDDDDDDEDIKRATEEKIWIVPAKFRKHE